ncbi:HEAT repeat-containing protein 5B-like isoform X3 [Gordionus sp. m RMFG-2023]|uniref:HEAT repeat-containing protein 5B-like isoform X3 n=1 Tax=Gordionus sp. m RMFG-2023 TaxID=3053472 RepID=UPI0031FBF290
MEDTYMLLDILNKCNDILKINNAAQGVKEHLINPSVSKLFSINIHKPIDSKRCTLTILSNLYVTLGKLTGRCNEETLSNIMKLSKLIENNTAFINNVPQPILMPSLKNNNLVDKNNQFSAEILKLDLTYALLQTIYSIISTLGKHIPNHIIKDVYKSMIIKNDYLLEKEENIQIGSQDIMLTKMKAAECILAMSENFSPIYMADHENLIATCLKAFENSDALTRSSIGNLVGNIVHKLVFPDSRMLQENQGNNKWKILTIQDGFNVLCKAVHSKLNATLAKLNSSQSALPNFLVKSSPDTTEASIISAYKSVHVGIIYAYFEFVAQAIINNNSSTKKVDGGKTQHLSQTSWVDTHFPIYLDHIIHDHVIPIAHRTIWPRDLGEFGRRCARVLLKRHLTLRLSQNEAIFCSTAILSRIEKFAIGSEFRTHFMDEYSTNNTNFKNRSLPRAKDAQECATKCEVLCLLLRQFNDYIIDMGPSLKKIIQDYPNVQSQPWAYLAGHSDANVSYLSVLCLKNCVLNVGLSTNILKTYVNYYWSLLQNYSRSPKNSSNKSRIPFNSCLGHSTAFLTLWALYTSNTSIVPPIHFITTDSILDLIDSLQGYSSRKGGDPISKFYAENEEIVDEKVLWDTIEKIRAGWQTLNCVIITGESWVKRNVAKFISIWEHFSAVTPDTLKKLKNLPPESQNWYGFLENFCGTLYTMDKFVERFKDRSFMPEGHYKSFAHLVGSALAFISNITETVRNLPPNLIIVICRAKSHLFSIINHLPPKTFEKSYNTLLREIVVETLQSADSFSSSYYQNDTTTNNMSILYPALSSPIRYTSAPHIPSAVSWGRIQNIDGAGYVDNDQKNFGRNYKNNGINAEEITVVGCQETVIGILMPKYTDTGRGQKQELENLLDSEIIVANYHLYNIDSSPLISNSNTDKVSLTGSLTYPSLRLNPPFPCILLDSSLALFAKIFPFIADKHRLQILKHFNSTPTRMTSNANASTALPSSTGGTDNNSLTLNQSEPIVITLINISVALLLAFRNLESHKLKLCTSPGQSPKIYSELKSAILEFVTNAFAYKNRLLRILSTHLLAKLVSIEKENKLAQDVFRNCLEKLKNVTDPFIRSSYALALGMVYKYVDRSSGDFKSAINLLVTLSQDLVSSEVQLWSLTALYLVLDNNHTPQGVREYTESLLNHFCERLLRENSSRVSIRTAICKCISALINGVGPELKDNSTSMINIRSLFFTISSILQRDHIPSIKTDAILCLQQLYMFVPTQHFQISDILNYLINCSAHTYPPLRKASISFLKQLIQKEPENICSILEGQNISTSANTNDAKRNPFDLLNFLIRTLNREREDATKMLIKYTIINLLNTPVLIDKYLSHWISLFGTVLTSKISNTSSPLFELSQFSSASINDENEENHFSSSAITTTPITNAALNPVNENIKSNIRFNSPSVENENFWEINVKLFCAERLLALVKQSDGHGKFKRNRRNEEGDPDLDLALARKLVKKEPKNDNYLVLHLSELVRLSFVCVTNTERYAPITVAGLEILAILINVFQYSPDPDYVSDNLKILNTINIDKIGDYYEESHKNGGKNDPNYLNNTSDGSNTHYLLEQYQAQMSACLRQVFNSTQQDTTHVGNGANNNNVFSNRHDKLAIKGGDDDDLESKGIKSSSPIINDCTNLERDSRVLAKASQVCSLWVSAGIRYHNEDIKKIRTLLLDSFYMLKSSLIGREDCYAVIEKLAIIQAWAEIFIVENEKHDFRSRESFIQNWKNDNNHQTCGEIINLTCISHQDLDYLKLYWTMALKDYTLLNLSKDFQKRINFADKPCHFYTRELCNTSSLYYQNAWPTLIKSMAYYIKVFLTQDLMTNDQVQTISSKDANSDSHVVSKDSANESHEHDCNDSDRKELLHLILGISLEALCNSCLDLSIHDIIMCLDTLIILFGSQQIIRYILTTEPDIVNETIQILHKISIAHSLDTDILALVGRILGLIFRENWENNEYERHSHNKSEEKSHENSFINVNHVIRVSGCRLTIQLLKDSWKDHSLMSECMDVLGLLALSPVTQKGNLMSPFLPICLSHLYALYKQPNIANIKSNCLSHMINVLSSSYKNLINKGHTKFPENSLEYENIREDSEILNAGTFGQLNFVFEALFKNVLKDSQNPKFGPDTALEFLFEASKFYSIALRSKEGMEYNIDSRYLPLTDFQEGSVFSKYMDILGKLMDENVGKPSYNQYLIIFRGLIVNCPIPLSHNFVRCILPQVLKHFWRFHANIASSTPYGKEGLTQIDLSLDVMLTCLDLSDRNENQAYIHLLTALICRMAAQHSTPDLTLNKILLTKITHLASSFPAQIKVILKSDPRLKDILETLTADFKKIDEHNHEENYNNENRSQLFPGDAFETQIGENSHKENKATTITGVSIKLKTNFNNFG